MIAAATRSIVAAISGVPNPPKVLVNSSAVGYYGDSGAEPRTEDSRPGTGFLAEIAQEWESEAQKAERTGTRVVLLRTGVVLEKSGGALPEMMRPFRLFAGGRPGVDDRPLEARSLVDFVDQHGDGLLFAGREIGRRDDDGAAQVRRGATRARARHENSEKRQTHANRTLRAGLGHDST